MSTEKGRSLTVAALQRVAVSTEKGRSLTVAALQRVAEKHGTVLKMHNHPEEARRALETAAALGAPADMLSLDLKSILERAPFR